MERPRLSSAVAAENMPAHAAVVLSDDEREDEAARLAAAGTRKLSATREPQWLKLASAGSTLRALEHSKTLAPTLEALDASALPDFVAWVRQMQTGPYPVTVSSFTQSGPWGEILPMVFLDDAVQTRWHIILLSGSKQSARCSLTLLYGVTGGDDSQTRE